MGRGGICGGAGGRDGNGGARGNMSDRTGGVAAPSPTNWAERRARQEATKHRGAIVLWLRTPFTP